MEIRGRREFSLGKLELFLLDAKYRRDGGLAVIIPSARYNNLIGACNCRENFFLRSGDTGNRRIDSF